MKSMLPLVERDAWLWPVADRIERRHADYERTKAWIEQTYGSLYDFAGAHTYYGLHPTSSSRWVFREWLPHAQHVFLTGDFNGWDYTSHPLRKVCNERGEWQGDWEIFLDEHSGGNRLTHNSCYKIYVHGADGAWHLRMPAYTFFTEQNPDSKEFKAKVWESGERTAAKDVTNTPGTNARAEAKASAADKAAANPTARAATADSLLIYEAHIGMAQEKEGVGTYREFTENVLPRIQAAGYNTLQLMGIAEHPYYGSFGYHVSNFFAPSSRFGTPDELRNLIATAHRMGLKVLMDIVHAHFVSNLNEGLWALDGSPDLYNYPEPRGTHPYWGSKMFAFNKNEVRRFLLSNLRYWMEDFGFDGFRFDGVTAMMYFHRGYTDYFGSYQNYFGDEVDEDALIYLRLANDLLDEIAARRNAQPQATPPQPEALRPTQKITIAEEVSGMPGTTAPCQDGGLGFDYRLSMGIPDFWIKLLKERSDEDWVMQEIWNTLNDRLPNVPQIAYCESHDQALVGDQTLAFRLMGAAMYTDMGQNSNSPIIERGLAMHKMIRLISLFAGSGDGGYLNFMGNEFGHPEWIDFPREGNQWSYHYARRQWSLSDRSDLKYRFLLAFDRAMIDLAAKIGLRTMGFARLCYLHESDKVMAFDLLDGRYVLAFNWHPSSSFPDYRLPVHRPGRYRLVLSSDAADFGGFGRTNADIRYFSQPYAAPNAAAPHHAQVHASTAQYLQVYLVHRTAQVWELED